MRRLVAVAVLVVLLLAVTASAAFADANCTGNLGDRPSSCFNAGPASDEVGFHGPH